MSRSEPPPRPAYAGIGSRRTPAAPLVGIEAVALRLAQAGWVLRTGLSPGADQAFYRGARAGRGAVELYLPHPGFEARARLPGEGADVAELARAAAPAQALRIAARRGIAVLNLARPEHLSRALALDLPSASA